MLTGEKSNPLLSWLDDRELFLAEDIRHKGRMGHHYSECPGCLREQDTKPAAPRYRCKECEGDEILCGRCMVQSHRYNGLHFIEVRITLIIRFTFRLISLGLEWGLF